MFKEKTKRITNIQNISPQFRPRAFFSYENINVAFVQDSTKMEIN